MRATRVSRRAESRHETLQALVGRGKYDQWAVEDNHKNSGGEFSGSRGEGNERVGEFNSNQFPIRFGNIKWIWRWSGWWWCTSGWG